MQHKYIVVDDTGWMHMHGHQFETVQQAFDFMYSNKLAMTHLVYNLDSAQHMCPSDFPEYVPPKS